MDIPRPKTQAPRRYLYGSAAVLLVGCVTLGLGRLRSAPPSIERASVWVDQVQRGEMLRLVRGPGTLVPEHIRWITAETAGRVERIVLRPGVPVTEDTLLVELSNPDVMLQSLEAERQLTSAEATLMELKSTLEAQRLAQQSSLATLETELAAARRQATADEHLRESQFASSNEADGTRDKAAELATRLELERQRLAVMKEGLKDRLASQHSQIEKLRAVAVFRNQQVSSMQVKAGGRGVLQELPLELGQWVVPGTLLAKVVQPEQLKAELRIPETQAQELQLGQQAEIDTHNGVIKGHVSRIYPAAQEGAVRVDVALEGELPKGARPDLSVEGSIELERLPDILHVGRPTSAKPDATIELFKLVSEDMAQRVTVRIGRASANAVEIRSGLAAGERVILSDMSSWDSAEMVRLK